MTSKTEDSSATRHLIEKRDPKLPPSQVRALAGIWDQVVHELMQATFDLERSVERDLHINVKAEMIFEAARLSLFFAEQVIGKRANGRDLAAIDPVIEREECLGPAGRETIHNTSRMAHEHLWDRRRWTRARGAI